MSISIITEKILTLSMLGCAFVVALMSIREGDTFLGLLLLTGQAQSLFHANSTGHELAHYAVHKRL